MLLTLITISPSNFFKSWFFMDDPAPKIKHLLFLCIFSSIFVLANREMSSSVKYSCLLSAIFFPDNFFFADERHEYTPGGNIHSLMIFFKGNLQFQPFDNFKNLSESDSDTLTSILCLILEEVQPLATGTFHFRGMGGDGH